MRSFYLQLTDATSAPLERAWNVLRVIVALVLIPLSFLLMDGMAGSVGIVLACLAVITYSFVIRRLIAVGNVRAAFLAGFALDNIVVIVSWWLTVDHFRPPGYQSDMWLSIMPITILGVARSGSRLGISYVVMMVAVLMWLTLGFEDPNSYAVEQLPARVVFLTVVGGLSVWLVGELNFQREAARDLQREAESLAEIGRVIGSTLDIRRAFTLISEVARQLIPYDVIVLADLGEAANRAELLGCDAPGLATVDWSSVSQIEFKEEQVACLAQRETRLLTGDACARLTETELPDGQKPFAQARSLIVAPVTIADQVGVSLFAVASRPSAFNLRHARTLTRIAELIGASMTNHRLYEQALQLAEERDARLRMNAEIRKLERENESQAVFLSAVSHELRTPLTSIIAFNDLVLRNRDNNLTERDLKHLELIRRNGSQLKSLVEDLLDLSHIEAGHVALYPERFSASELIDDVMDSLAPILAAQKRQVNGHPEDNDLYVIADRQRLSQVISNLITNAAKYSPEDTPIEVEWGVREGRFEVIVRDDGPGIPDAEQKHVFQPFFRARQHREGKIPGTGLGLVVSRSLLEAHGGGISLHSSTDEGEQGTTVRIWVPVDGSGIVRKAADRDSA